MADLERPYGIDRRLVIKEPWGVAGIITPYNYPIQQLCAKVGPALAAGNTVVLKPSPFTPVVGLLRRQGRRRGDRHPARRPQRADHHLGRGQRGDRRPSRRRHDLLHRLHRRRAAHHGDGRPAGEEAVPGARRQVGQHRPRRRRHRRGRDRGRVPDVAATPARAASTSPACCCPGRTTRPPSRWPPRPPPRCRGATPATRTPTWARRSASAHQQRVPGLHREGPRRGRPADRRRRRPVRDRPATSSRPPSSPTSSPTTPSPRRRSSARSWP